MTTDTNRLKAKVSALNDSLDELESKLEPLFAQTLPESVIGLETIQQAKLQTVIPYLVYDLIFIYLKSRGIDPKTHAVVSELDRVRQYFEKIANAESSEKRKAPVDKEAASRFIKHAIAQATRNSQSTANGEGSLQPTTTVPVPVKVTSKMQERAEYERRLKEAGSEEEDEELQVFDVPPEQDVDMDDVEVPKEGLKRDKGKQRSDGGEMESTSTQAGIKRRRPVMDPFAGYDSPASAAENKSSPTKKNKGSEDTVVSGEATSGRSTPLSNAERKAAKKAGRKTKKSLG